MSKQNFYTLLERYRSGQCTEREKQMVEQWFAMLDEETPLRSDRENEEISERLWREIQRRRSDSAYPLPVRSVFWKWLAAAIVLASSAIYWQTLRSNRLQEGSPFGINDFGINHKSPLEYTDNTSANEIALLLPDGSEVVLSPGSRIGHLPEFDGSLREVFLEGKAFFDVVRDTNRPFRVHSGAIVTKVLGTSFLVEGKKDENIVEVSVMSGTVSVSQKAGAAENDSGAGEKGVILTANQKVKFSTELHTFETGLVDIPVRVTQAEKENPEEPESFLFEDTPLTDVIGKLEKAYGIEIVLENEALSRCLFRGDITEQPLFTKLDLLCASVNASYKIRGTRVVVSGQGCSL